MQHTLSLSCSHGSKEKYIVLGDIEHAIRGRLLQQSVQLLCHVSAIVTPCQTTCCCTDRICALFM